MSDLPLSDWRPGAPLAPDTSGRSAPGDSPGDVELIGRVLSGEIGLFRVLMRRYEARLFRVARTVVSTDDAADAVLEETFVDAFRHLEHFRGQDRLSAWLSRIALAHATEQDRADTPLSRLAARIAGLFDHESSESKRPRTARSAGKGTALERVEATLADLPPSTRTVLVMRDVEGMSTAETADCLGLSEESVRLRLLRGRAFLHGRLAPVDQARLGDVYAMPEATGRRVADRVLRRLLGR